jgi:hypothetical protein
MTAATRPRRRARGRIEVLPSGAQRVSVLGSLSIGRVNGETVDAFYAQLRTCRVRCGGRPYVDRTDVDHECDERQWWVPYRHA